jgi:hypothetical protein
MAVIQDLLPCEVSDFLCQYLGLPLTVKKLTRDQIQPINDRIADQLPGWKVDLMTRAGQRIQVQFVLTGTLVYPTMAMDILSSTAEFCPCPSTELGHMEDFGAMDGISCCCWCYMGESPRIQGGLSFISARDELFSKGEGSVVDAFLGHTYQRRPKSAAEPD